MRKRDHSMLAGRGVALATAFLVGTLGAACGPRDHGTGQDGGLTGDGTVSGDASGLGDGSTTPDAAACETTLCGSPAQCCTTDEECIEDQCLPTCASGVRCGANQATCCSAGQVCLSGGCSSPGGTCADSYDCQQPGEFCEPTLGRCLPQPDPLTCETVPIFSQLAVTEEWTFETDEIISIPVVGDVNGDGLPEVVVNLTRQGANDWVLGNIAVLDGRNGAELLRIPHDPPNDQWGSHGRTTIAIGDVSGDGVPDILYATRPVNAGGQSYLVAVEGDGTLLWVASSGGTPYPVTVVNAAITLANFDADPMAELVVGATLFDHDGELVWDAGIAGTGGGFGTNDGYTGGISAVADLDGDGAPEIVSGRHAWAVDWQPGANPGDPPNVSVTPLWTYAGPDGYPAVADFDGNGVPEVVLVGSRQIAVLNGQTGQLFCGVDPTDAACVAAPAQRTQPLLIPGGASANRGGPPTVADFDADGRPEIGVAGGYAYSVYDLNRAGEVVVQPAGDPLPAAGALFVRWSQLTQDLSSNATGSSVFDFQGDGAAEVIYADECYLRVYSGTDGEVQLEIPNSSSTIHEYPLVVDVDADGNSEILIVANQHNLCTGVTGRQGLFVYGDANDEWVPTRRVWTQHAYHVTNATSGGNVPLLESNNWTTAGLNNYRQNVQGNGVFNAPDLTLELTVGLGLCAQGQLELRARVANAGALGVLPGAEVTFYQGADATGPVLGTATVAVPLLPGASTVVTLAIPNPTSPTDYFAAVAGTGASLLVEECDGTNNADGEASASCPVVN